MPRVISLDAVVYYAYVLTSVLIIESFSYWKLASDERRHLTPNQVPFPGPTFIQ